MSAAATTLTVGAWLFLLAGGFWAVATARVRRWVGRPTGGTWVRRVGALAVVTGALATGAFFVHPPLGVYVLAAAGSLAYAAGALDAARASATALDAVDSTDGAGRRLRAFWCAASLYHRGTRLWFALALVAFLLAALTAALSVDVLVRSAGAFSQGGVLACVVSLAAVGVFVPAARNEAVAEAVADAVDHARP